MKKIISGKVYDTDTAQELGCCAHSLEDRLYGWAEYLYRKRTGEFFLHGFGGPGSKYAKPTGGGSWSGSEIITPLSWTEAQAWAEDHLSGEAYESIFGEVTEDDSKMTVTLSLQASTVEAAKREAAKQGIGLSAYVEACLEAACAR